MRTLVEERWSLLQDNVLEEWPGIDKDEVHWVEGDLDRLIAVLQLNYGYTGDEALKRVENFIERALDKVQ